MPNKLPIQFEILLAAIDKISEELVDDRAFWDKKNTAEDNNRPVLDQIDNQLCVLNHVSSAIRKAFS